MLKSFKNPAARAAGAFTFIALSSATAVLADDSPKSDPYELPGIVIVADRAATPRAEIGSAITIIDRAQIERSQLATVAELLRAAPGLDIVASGGAGTKTSVFMRGSNSSHTLVIVDGVEMNDPSDPNGAFDFAHLRSDNIDRIEILRGAQSVLYGSDALGGVINIITRSGSGAPQVTASAEGGAYGSYRAGADVSGAGESVKYALSLTGFNAEGFSHTGGGAFAEKDGYSGFEFSGKARADLTQSLQLSASARYHDSETDLDQSFPSFENPGVFDDPNYYSAATKRHERLALEWSRSGSDLSVELFGAHARTDRYSADKPDAVYGFTESEASYRGDRYQYGANIIAKLNSAARLVGGVETERETLDQTTYWGFGAPEVFNGSDATTNAGFVSLRYTMPRGASLTAGLRFDDHDRFGGHTSLRITALAPVFGEDTKLRASFSDGFNAPSVWQLFAPFFGDSTLLPEKSESWDVALQQRVSDQLSFSLGWFRSTFEDIFGYDPTTFRTVNIDRALTEGAEVSLTLSGERTRAAVEYTYTLAQDRADGSALLRRPKNKFSLILDGEISDNLQGQLRLRHIGSRFDLGAVKLNSYTVTDIAVTQRLSHAFALNWRVENLFSESYQEIANYNAPGLSLYAGAAFAY